MSPNPPCVYLLNKNNIAGVEYLIVESFNHALISKVRAFVAVKMPITSDDGGCTRMSIEWTMGVRLTSGREAWIVKVLVVVRIARQTLSVKYY